MARLHRGVVYGAAGILGLGVFGSWAVSQLWGVAFGGEKKEKVEVVETGFDVQVEPAPKEEPEPKPEEKTLTQAVEEKRQERERPARRERQEQRKQTLTEKWLDRVNSGGMYAFGEDNGYSGVSNADGECRLLRPVRVQALMADNATTDIPGIAIGFVTKDIQGVDSEGEWCVAIPEYSVVALEIQGVGEYATNRAPAKVAKIWLTDGFEVVVDQPAKYIDGIPGIVGEADHHTASKVLAGLGSVLFGLANNVSRAFSFNSNQVTNPVEDTLRKKLERPAEIKLTGEVFEFDLMPTATPGY